jgi:hypothetical protein
VRRGLLGHETAVQAAAKKRMPEEKKDAILSLFACAGTNADDPGGASPVRIATLSV